MHAKLRVDDRHRVGAHLAGPDRVVGGFRRAFYPVDDLVVVVRSVPGATSVTSREAIAGAVMTARAMRIARTVSSASGGDDRKLKLIAGGRCGSAAVMWICPLLSGRIGCA